MKQSVCYTHFHSNKVFRGDLMIFFLMNPFSAIRRTYSTPESELL